MVTRANIYNTDYNISNVNDEIKGIKAIARGMR